MRGLKTERTASVVVPGTRSSRTCVVGHYELGVDATQSLDWPPHSTNSAPQSDQPVPGLTSAWPAIKQRNSALQAITA